MVQYRKTHYAGIAGKLDGWVDSEVDGLLAAPHARHILRDTAVGEVLAREATLKGLLMVDLDGFSENSRLWRDDITKEIRDLKVPVGHWVEAIHAAAEWEKLPEGASGGLSVSDVIVYAVTRSKEIVASDRVYRDFESSEKAAHQAILDNLTTMRKQLQGKDLELEALRSENAVLRVNYDSVSKALREYLEELDIDAN